MGMQPKRVWQVQECGIYKECMQAQESGEVWQVWKMTGICKNCDFIS